jgi:hypothetical protein
MSKIVHGIVHGKTIELDQEVEVPDGQFDSAIFPMKCRSIGLP